MPRAEPRPGGRVGSGGFTLLEMVVAVGIFSVIAVVIFRALGSTLDTEARLRARQTDLAALVSTVATLERDLRFVVPRGVRDGQGEPEPAFWVWPADPPAPGELLRLTVSQPADASPGEADIVRVAWRMDNGRLYRVSWRVLDRAPDSAEDRRRMLADVEAVDLRLLVYDRQSGLGGSDEWAEPARLPDGVSLTLRMGDGRVLQRILELPHAF